VSTIHVGALIVKEQITQKLRRRARRGNPGRAAVACKPCDGIPIEGDREHDGLIVVGSVAHAGPSI